MMKTSRLLSLFFVLSALAGCAKDEGALVDEAVQSVEGSTTELDESDPFVGLTAEEEDRLAAEYAAQQEGTIDSVVSEEVAQVAAIDEVLEEDPLAPMRAALAEEAAVANALPDLFAEETDVCQLALEEAGLSAELHASCAAMPRAAQRCAVSSYRVQAPSECQEATSSLEINAALMPLFE